MKLLYTFLVALFLFSVPMTLEANSLLVNNVSSFFKEVKITTFRTNADRATIEEAFAKDEEILHIIFEGDLVAIFTETNLTDSRISEKLELKIKVEYNIVNTIIGDRNPRLFNR